MSLEHRSPFDDRVVSSSSSSLATVQHRSLLLCQRTSHVTTADDKERYPTNLETIQLNPILPKRLPPQHTIVVKFVRESTTIEELRTDLEQRFTSIYSMENMMGTMRSKTRHVRIDLKDKREYENILNSGKICIHGELLDVDEYLPAPKILICSRCNEPGHVKKQCQLKFDRCRRCGKDRQLGEHKNCLILCHHCGDPNHLSTDYRCPTLSQFRYELVKKLRQQPNRLPAHVQLFIPVDCRTNGDDSKVLRSDAHAMDRRQQSYDPPHDNGELSHAWPGLTRPNDHRMTTTETAIDPSLNGTIKMMSDELADLKKKFEDDRKQIEQKYKDEVTNIRQGWLILQQQIQTQNEILSAVDLSIQGILFESCNLLINMVGTLMADLMQKTSTDEDRQRIGMMAQTFQVCSTQIVEKKALYIAHQQQMDTFMTKQKAAYASAMNILFPTDNV